ncbi:uncharacterized protein ccdc50b isoform X2 [Brachyhypopomus gauderio]|uniref:uncharacterized protein ccdc50b isoform X2 n=1 Tax=Brachyhypopomus gauderio TaxID=698409 RepID=UPI004041397E
MNATEMETDASHLPRHFDVEQFYNDNMQQRRDMQHDGRLARRLQEEEEEVKEEGCHRHSLRQLEEQDCKYAKMIEEDLRQREEEQRRREAEDEEMARRLQEEEELQIRQQRAQAGCHDDSGASPLSEGLEVWAQVVRDADLARRLQEEEDRQVDRECRGPPDFHAAQVAQDEEIAHYMQHQERKSHSRSHDLGAPGRSQDLGASGRSRDPIRTIDASLRKVEALHPLRERLNSQGLSSPVEELCLTQHTLGPECTTLGAQSVRNIAEELDPTFTPRKRESQIYGSSSGVSPGVHLAPRSPHSIFYDYLPEPAFVPPTRRHGNQSDRDRAKEKRYNCKQQ